MQKGIVTTLLGVVQLKRKVHQHSSSLSTSASVHNLKIDRKLDYAAAISAATIFAKTHAIL